MKTIGEKIKTKRNEKRMTQQELADKIGVSYTTVSLYESNSRKPSFKALARIADVFDVSTAYFFEEEDPSEAKRDKVKVAMRNMDKLSDEDVDRVNDIIKTFLNSSGKDK
ncbi:helix-turn-helix domain-containing protein [Planococcus sp. X10-3]|uniref:helix-turn-helix domain-containing protein n=1 Tax=Planococcus sp. X10-3 TaxID=3061240 RepID=UPI003BAFC556